MITVQRIADKEGFTVAFSVVIDTKESTDSFTEMVQRATNLWPDAIPEIKEFADLITHGKILQDYRSQDTSPAGKKKREYKIGRILPSAANEDSLIVYCTCGLSTLVLKQAHSYQCPNCKTTHNVKDAIK